MTQSKIFAGRYLVDELIGEGAFAAVYRATDRKEAREVAVKVLTMGAGTAKGSVASARFTREAELVSTIDHPDVVDIYEYGIDDDGQMFIVLELLEGAPLSDHLETHGPMELDRAIRLMTRCLDALQAAHGVGAVHRDLKPANLFLEPGDGIKPERLRILDFGLAFVSDEAGQRLSRTGQVTGTLGYLAPEYIQRQCVTPALDVYQMALILAELVSGSKAVPHRAPFDALIAHVQGDLNIPVELLVGDVGDVMERATANDHVDRYEDAGAFRDALQALAPEQDAELATSFGFEQTIAEFDGRSKAALGPAHEAAHTSPGATLQVSPAVIASVAGLSQELQAAESSLRTRGATLEVSPSVLASVAEMSMELSDDASTTPGPRASSGRTEEVNPAVLASAILASSGNVPIVDPEREASTDAPSDE